MSERKINIKDVWGIYTRAAMDIGHSDTSLQIKKSAMDLFLRLCYQQIKENNEIVKIYEMRCLVNTLCQEFMNDILLVTGGSDDEDPTALEDYLLRGRGWLLLYVIYKNGVQGLTVGRDFSNLLVTLLPFCLKFEVKDIPENEEASAKDTATLPSIGSSFTNMQNSVRWQKIVRQREKAIPQYHRNRNTVKQKLSSSNQIKKYKKVVPHTENGESSNTEQDIDGDRGDLGLQHVKRNRKPLRRRFPSGSRFQEGLSRQDSFQEEEERELTNILAEVTMVKSSCSIVELCSLILNLLQTVCLQDLEQVSLVKVISPSILPHLVHICTGLYPSANVQADNLLAADWKKDDSIYFQRQILRTIMSVCGVIATQQNGVNVILGHRVTQVLLDVAQQLHSLQEIKEQLSLSCNRHPQTDVFTGDFLLFSEIVIGLLMCFDIIFQNLPFNLIYIKNAVQLVEEFDEGKGFVFCEQIIGECDHIRQQKRENLDNLFDVEPLKVIGSFLNTLKSVKVSYIHSVTCLKRKHQNCLYYQYFDHHHDILGLSVIKEDEHDGIDLVQRSPQMLKSMMQNSSCLIACWCTFLLDLLPKMKSKISQIEILNTLHLSSLCCCMHLETFIKCVIQSVEAFSPGVQSYALDILNKTILYVYLGAGVPDKSNSKSSSLACLKCSQHSVEESIETKLPRTPTNFDSGFSSTGFKITDQKPLTVVKSRWSVLEVFRTILFSSNKSLGDLTAKHLLVLSIEGKVKLKEELFFRVYMQAFQSVVGNLKSSPQSSSEEEKVEPFDFSIATKVHCLSALPYLLQVDTVLKTFLTKHGIGKICRLLEDNKLREPILKVFEALILLDEQRLKKEECGDQNGSEALKGGMVIKAFIDGLTRKTKYDINSKSQIPSMCSLPDTTSRDGTCDKAESESRPRNLALMVDMWETCGKLCVISEKYVSRLQDSPCLGTAENTLLLILQQLINSSKCDIIYSGGSEDSGQESVDVMIPPIGCYMWLSLLRALLIVCSSCYKYLDKQRGQQISMWKKIQQSFQACSSLPAAKLKTMFDILLSSAMPKKSSILDLSRAKQLSQMYVKEDSIEDDEIRQLLQLNSDEEMDGVMPNEKGYDADTEHTSSDIRRERRNLDHPADREYFPSVFRLMIELLVWSQKTNSGREILSQILLKLLQTLTANHAAVMTVCQEGLLYEILTGFWHQLISKDTSTSVRNSLMSLIQLLAQHRVTGLELQKILQLLLHPGIPTDLVLSTILSIVENSKSKPHKSVTFPCDKIKDVSHKHKAGGHRIGKQYKSSQSTDTAMAPLLRSLSTVAMVTTPQVMSGDDEGSGSGYVKKATQEVWSKAAMQQELLDGIPWPPAQCGFTVALWLQVEDGHCQTRKTTWSHSSNNVYTSSSEEYQSEDQNQGRQSPECSVSSCLHVLSVGNEDKLLELWVNCSTGHLTFRLTSEKNVLGELILREATVKDCLRVDQWHHLVMSYSEDYSKTESNETDTTLLKGKVTLIVDGWKCHTVWLPHTAVTPVKHFSDLEDIPGPCLCIGHVFDDCTDCRSQVTWSMSSLMLFRGCCVSEEESFFLYTQGPSCLSISQCDCTSAGVPYAPCLSKHVISNTRISADVLVALKQVDLDQLRASLLLSYNAGNSGKINLYGILGRLEVPSILASNLGLTSQSASNLLCQHPCVADVAKNGNLVCNTNYTLEKALEETGGADAILFLVAKVFEGHRPDKINSLDVELQQAKALQLLFAFVNHSPYIARDYLAASGNLLLTKVLTSSRSIVGYHTLKVLMDACTTESLFRHDLDTTTVVMRRKSEAVITNVSIVEELLMNWHVWERAEEDVMLLMFRALASLIREDHPHQAFNIKQFQSIGIINRIFLMYQERIQDAMPSFSPDVAQSAVSILQGLMGTPPDVHLIVAVCDFLLHVHPAESTFIKHSRSDFHFSTWWDLPSTKRTPLMQIYRPRNINDAESGRTRSSGDSDKRWPSETDTYSEDDRSHDMYPEMKVTSSLETDPLAEKQMEPRRKEEIEEQARENDVHKTVPGDKNNMFSFKSKDKMDTSETVSDLEHSETCDMLEHTVKSTPSSVVSGTDSMEDKLSSLEAALVASFSGSSTFLMRSLSEEEGLIAPLSNVSFDIHEGEVIMQAEVGLTALCVGLLQTLCNVVVTMPDSTTQKVFQKVLKPEILIILSHNNSPEIRTGVLKLLICYLVRATSDQVDDFLRKSGFYLIGAQLYQYPTHAEQVTEVLSFILNKPVCFRDNLEFGECLEDLTTLQQSSLSLFLSLVEMSVYEDSLCFNCLSVTFQMFTKSPVVGSLMLEHGLVETLCNMLARLNKMPPRPSDIEGIDEKDILTEHIQTILCTVAVREFSASGATHVQRVEEILELLRHLEDRERAKPGDRSCQVLVVRTVQLSIVSSVLQYIEKVSQDNKANNNWFSKPSSQHKVTSSSMVNIPGSTARTLPTSSSQPSLLSQHKHPHHLPFRGASFSSDTKFKMVGGSKFPFLIDQSQEDLYSSSQSPTSDRESISGASDLWSSQYNRAVSMDTSQLRPAKPGLIASMLESFGRKKRLSTTPVSDSELIDRFKRFLVMAVDIFVYADKKEVKRESHSRTLSLLFDRPKSESTETTFMRHLFDFLYRAYEMTLSQDRIFPKRPKNTVMWGAKDVTRVQMGRLIVHMMCKKQEFDNRTYTLSYLTGETRGIEILKIILATSPDLGGDIAYYLHDLLTIWEDCFNTQQREDAFKILSVMRRSGIQVLVSSPGKALTPDSLHNLQEEKKAICAKFEKGKQIWQKKHDSTVERILHKYDKLYQQLSALALEVTRSVSQFQTVERNKFIDHIKRTMTAGIQIKKSWQHIVQNLTHERAVWFSQESYPHSWELDPTEGPSRVRKRLKRNHLGIDSKFLKEESQNKLDCESVDPPLIYLFEDDHQMSDSAALIYQLYRNEKIQHTCRCTAVSPSSETKGELLIGENSIFFVADEAITDMNYTQVLLGNKDQLSMTWPYEDVREIHKRWFQLRDIGIEIFLTNGKTCILACQDTTTREDLYLKLTSLELPNLLEMVDLEAIQKSWLEGQMTNYEYLTYLNKLAGRSFNDLMQYPVFPFVLKEYSSATLNLKDADIYRDLSKPISIQEKSRERKYMDNYEILKQEFEKGGQNDISGLKMTPFHYGSHYSNSGTVLHFLIRVPPYTKMFLTYQDSSFDIPDRTFHSVETSWRLASFQSTTDVKELIPEFFFFPEFLTNLEGFDFGRRQTGQIVNDVILPPWSKNDPRLFILIHRQVLESDIVTKNLNHWIDLVFGYKQQGEEAVKAINVFHPATYFGMDISHVKEHIKRQALKTMIRTYGQTPKQLFTKSPHPPQGPTGGGPASSSLFMQLFDIGSSSAVSDSDSCTPMSPYIVSAINTVQGLKWGVYLGSPQLPPPKIVWQMKCPAVIASLVALPTGEILGVGEDSYCATMYSKQKVSTVYASTDVTWAAIISWQYPDGILRINNNKSKPSTNFLQHSPFEQITCLASVPDCRLLFVGGTGGIITVYQTVHNQAKESHIQVRGSRRVLHGHAKDITCLEVCKPYSILVSGSLDNTCIIWDLNRLCYVRSISGHKSGVKVVSVSSTLGDIASVSNKGLGSCLQLHTINASLIASYNCEDTINCIAFSAAPEGRSINVIAGGLSSGCIRLWSTWDLAHLKDLQHESLFAKPVVSLTFTQDSQSLFMSTSDGTVTQWAQSKDGRTTPPRFLSCLPESVH